MDINEFAIANFSFIGNQARRVEFQRFFVAGTEHGIGASALVTVKAVLSRCRLRCHCRLPGLSDTRLRASG
ncbi:MAG: hypothetical protein ACKJSG_07875, partial [Lentisphaeria bacterium]